MEQKSAKPQSVEEYLANCPTQALDALLQLRELIKSIAPEAIETISYAIPAYKLPGQGRAFVYISGYSNHVSIYPIPDLTNKTFEGELKPHIAGKGTLRFDLAKPLPKNLISKIVTSLYDRAHSSLN